MKRSEAYTQYAEQYPELAAEYLAVAKAEAEHEGIIARHAGLDTEAREANWLALSRSGKRIDAVRAILKVAQNRSLSGQHA